METGFPGFSGECINFFLSLKKNNSRDWFASHKNDFENHVLSPARDFVVALGRELEKFSPGIQAIPQIDKSIFRIYRDVRFSRDKSPCKTHLGLWFWEGAGKRMENSGYYFHLEPPDLMLGTGIYLFPKPLLGKYRNALLSEKHGPALAEAMKKLFREGYALGGKHYKKVPRGYDPEHRMKEMLLHNGLYAGMETKIPPEFFTPKITGYCVNHYKKMKPLHDWLSLVINDSTL
jgi:uncharacterized protein (TIGR02453 family)